MRPKSVISGADYGSWQFTPQNETTSIPVTFIWESPRGVVGELYEMNEVARSDETVYDTPHSL